MCVWCVCVCERERERERERTEVEVERVILRSGETDGTSSIIITSIFLFLFFSPH